MSIEDVVLVSTVWEDICSNVLQVDSSAIPLRVEAKQLDALGLAIPIHLRFPKHEASLAVALKREGAHKGDDELSVSPQLPSILESQLTMELTDICRQRKMHR